MDERTAFGILEISVTKEVDRIKKAYRAVLKHTNPEDDPEGFKRLRTAYETACAYAVSPQEEEEQCSQIDAWIKHAEEIYDSLSKRINVAQWESLLDEEICLDLEIGEEVKDRFFDFLMEHYRLPKKVWELFDQRYFIEEDKQQFLERYPENFVNFMIDQLHMAAGFPYGLFEGADDGDYDGFLNTYFDLYDAVEEEKKELAQDLLRNLDASGIFHPLVEMERYALEISPETQEDICTKVRGFLEKYSEEIRIQIPGAALLLKAGKQEEAARWYEEVLKKIPNHYTANWQLLLYYKEQGEYEKAKKRGEEIIRNFGANQELQTKMKEINDALLNKYKNKIKEGQITGEEYIEFGWCCLQNEYYTEGIDTLLSWKPEEKERTGYYCILERLYYSDKKPQQTEDMGYLWIEAIKKEAPGLTKEEQEHVPQRIAAAYYIMGRAWMEEEIQEEHALECLEKSLEYDDKQEECYLGKIVLLRKLNRRKEALEICDKILSLNEKSFWAYVYRMDLYVDLKNGQGVIDNYYKAREIYAYYPHLYETAAETYLKYDQYGDAIDVLKEAERLEISTPKLQYLYIRCKRILRKTLEDTKELKKEILKVLSSMKEQGEPQEYADVLAEAARCFSSLEEEKEALSYIQKAIFIRQEPDFYWVQSMIEMKLQEYTKALKSLEICEKAYPDGEEVYSRIGRCYFRLGEYEKALRYHKKVLELAPEHRCANSDILDIYKIWLDRNQNLAERKRLYEEGMFYASRQIEIEPNAYFYIERGNFHMSYQQRQRAVLDYEKAIELEPDNAYGYYNMGRAYEFMGKYEKALECFQKSLVVERPESRLETRKSMCECARKLGHYEEAIRYIKEELEAYPDDTGSKKWISILYAYMGKAEEASYWLKKKCGQDIQQMEYEKAVLYIQLGKGMEAELLLQGLQQKRYQLAKIAMAQAWNYLYNLDDKKRSAKAAKKAVSLEKIGTEDYLNACIILEEIYYRMGKQKRAEKAGEETRRGILAYYGEGAELTRNRKQYWYQMGKSYYFQGDYKNAKRWFGKMYGAMEDCSDCVGYRGRICCFDMFLAQGFLYEIEGDLDNAWSCYKSALQENPLDFDACYARKRLKKERKDDKAYDDRNRFGNNQ